MRDKDSVNVQDHSKAHARNNWVDGGILLIESLEKIIINYYKDNDRNNEL